jgi:hypothetical protein
MEPVVAVPSCRMPYPGSVSQGRAATPAWVWMPVWVPSHNHAGMELSCSEAKTPSRPSLQKGYAPSYEALREQWIPSQLPDPRTNCQGFIRNEAQIHDVKPVLAQVQLPDAQPPSSKESQVIQPQRWRLRNARFGPLLTVARRPVQRPKKLKNTKWQPPAISAVDTKAVTDMAEGDDWSERFQPSGGLMEGEPSETLGIGNASRLRGDEFCGAGTWGIGHGNRKNRV